MLKNSIYYPLNFDDGKTFIWFSLILIILFFAFASVSAKTIHVNSSTDNDEYDCGTIIEPCSSIQYVLAFRAEKGDKIKIQSGEPYSVGSGLNFNSARHINITLTGDDTTNTPTLQGNGGDSIVKIFQGITGVTIAYLKMNHNPTGPIQTYRAGVVQINADDTTIEHCEIHNGYTGIGIYSGHNITISNTNIYAMGTDGIILNSSIDISDIEIFSNKIHDNHRSGIKMFGVNQNNCLIYNNLIYNNCNSQTLTGTCRGADLASTGVKFYHNVVYGHNPNNVPGGSIFGGNRIVNNAFYNNGIGSGGGTNGGGGSYNFTYPATGLIGTGAITDPNPMFTDHSDHDFSLQPGSPLIDSGVDVGITVDFTGKSRPLGSNIDIGAFEYEPNQDDPPSVPINLKLIQ